MNKKNLILGKVDSYKKVYDKSVLTPILREEKRKQIGLNFKMKGVDIWNAYECTFLNKRGLPENYIGILEYDCNSKYIIESKSLKLYLNSFDNKLITKKEYERIVKRDLKEVLETKIQFRLVDLLSDFIDCDFQETQVSSRLKLSNYSSPESVKLKLEDSSWHSKKIFKSNSLRSLCPVTAQKDTGSVTIYMEGIRLPSDESLLELVVSFREHQEFHEQCIERMFKIIQDQCKLNELNIVGNYVRRGGIDIVPVRYLKDFYLEVDRKVRQ